MDLSGQKTEITLGDLEALREATRRAEARAITAERALAVALSTDVDAKLAPAVAALQAALPVVAFAVGNLDPISIGGWPLKELATLATTVQTLPYLPYHEELALGWLDFVRTATPWQALHAQGRDAVVAALRAENLQSHQQGGVYAKARAQQAALAVTPVTAARPWRWWAFWRWACWRRSGAV